MSHNKIYAGIGSRETPASVLERMIAIAHTLAACGWTLRSGHAPGADQAFEAGSLRAQGKMEIFLPWANFEDAPKGMSYIDASRLFNPQVERLAARFHPAWHRCSYGAKKLHSRNVHQILGSTLETPVDLVICWTKGGLRQGGTGQALRIAEFMKIPIFDLAVRSEQQLLDFLNYGVLPA